MLLPLVAGPCPVFSYDLVAEAPTALVVELRRAQKDGNFTPDESLESIEIEVPAGDSHPEIRFSKPLDRTGYYFIQLRENPTVSVRLSDERITGIVSVTNAFNKAVAKSSVQSPPADIGIDTFEFWLPKRRPAGHNLAMTITPALDSFGPANVQHGPARPTSAVNAWVADPCDTQPELTLSWPKPVDISRIVLEFDPDWDHPMESVLMTHPEETVPFMVRDFELLDDKGNVVTAVRDNHSARVEQTFDQQLSTSKLNLRILGTHGTPAAVFRVRVFG
jgi:hypothetical protein